MPQTWLTPDITLLSSTSALSLTLGMDQSNPRSCCTNPWITMRRGGISKVSFGQEGLQLEMWHQEKHFPPNIEIPSPCLNVLPHGGWSRGFHFRVLKTERAALWVLGHPSRKVYYGYRVTLCISISFLGLLWLSSPVFSCSVLLAHGERYVIMPQIQQIQGQRDVICLNLRGDCCYIELCSLFLNCILPCPEGF